MGVLSRLVSQLDNQVLSRAWRQKPNWGNRDLVRQANATRLLGLRHVLTWQRFIKQLALEDVGGSMQELTQNAISQSAIHAIVRLSKTEQWTSEFIAFGWSDWSEKLGRSRALPLIAPLQKYLK